MEDMVTDSTPQSRTSDCLALFSGKRVFVTGHTGFKGSWLCEWLLLLGAKVTGYSLAPAGDPALFDQLNLESRVEHLVGDLRDFEKLSAELTRVQPHIVFHLAAQPLVRESYREPVSTWETNVMGTIHLLEALRRLRDRCAAVMVTTDKVYENREWVHGYREEDPLGGYDPYSSSKGAAELAISAWRRSFFAQSPVSIASARAGNVIGGGDWAADRIVPDTMRALARDEPIRVRNPAATRPWQHVLDPLHGYLKLAAALSRGDREQSREVEGPYNFGPSLQSNQPVRVLVDAILDAWPGRWEEIADAVAPHEANLLNLTWEKAFHHLDWTPRWDFKKTVAKTVEWYRQENSGRNPYDLTREQIHEYSTGGPA